MFRNGNKIGTLLGADPSGLEVGLTISESGRNLIPFSFLQQLLVKQQANL